MSGHGAAAGPAAVRTRIKICGVRDVEMALHAARCGADAVGLVRVASSPRFVDAETALAVAAALPPWVAPVVVHADADAQEILEGWPHDWIQLHGAEPDIDPMLAGRAVIKALPANLSDEAILWWDRHPRVRALLIDAPRPGGGEPFDHGRLAALRPSLAKPLILAGGLSASTVGEAIHRLRPWAVDVSSAVERSRGCKDPGLVREFCAAVMAASTSR